MTSRAVVIVGAGASGLSAAAALKMRGIDALVLEQDADVGGTWARRYDRLRLHTVRRYSGLAYRPIARTQPRYLSRDDYVAYLRDYARHFELRVMPNTRVDSIRRVHASAPWRVASADDVWDARVVVVATGQYRIPRQPTWPGVSSFCGRLLHSADYRNAAPHVGQRVLVVGAGNSGAEIATDLADGGAAFVALSVRTPPPIVPRDPFGRPVQQTGMLLSRLPPRWADRLARITARVVLGDLTRYGLPAAAWRTYAERRVPVIDVGIVRALERGLVHVRPALVRLDAAGAIFADARAEPFDCIIAATGFDSGLGALLGASAALDAAGEAPLSASGAPTALPGLYFIDFVHSLRGHLFEANRTSLVLAENVDRYLAAANRGA